MREKQLAILIFATQLALFSFVVACGSPPSPSLTDAGTETGTNDGPSGPQPVVLRLLAGNAVDGPGSSDGMGAGAAFSFPSGIAIGSSGNVYVADTSNHTIRKIAPTGLVTTLAGVAGSPGSVDGTGALARFNSPMGVAVDSADNVYVADTGNNAIRKVSSSGVVTTLAGGQSGSDDGMGPSARFSAPQGVAVDGDGNIYVADRLNDTIRKVTPSGTVSTLAGTAHSPGSTDGAGAAARFNSPQGVAVDGTGNIYVADSFNDTIRKVASDGVVTTLAGMPGFIGSADGTGPAARFLTPSAVAVDGAGNVYVADTSNHTIRKVTPAGVVTTLAGLARSFGSVDGANARFRHPLGIAVDNSSNIYIADTFNHTIRMITPTGLTTTFAGAAGGGSVDGAGAAARFYSLQGVAADSAGNVFVADTENCTIRKITSGGVVTTLAGTTGRNGTADGTGTTASFGFPRGLAVDSAGNLYVADTGNATIRKVTPAGFVTTIAGVPGSTGSEDGTGNVARFNSPRGLTIDNAGNIYIADTINSTIRKIAFGSFVLTLAGEAMNIGSTDGADARFRFPRGVAVDSAGNVYVADTVNSTIRKVSPTGFVTTLAGIAENVGSADGTGPVAQFSSPTGLAVDSRGTIYVADTGNATIRRITPDGVVTTLAGTAGSKRVVLGTTPAFSSPTSLAIVGDSLAIVDNYAVLLLEHGAQQ